jgi:hypothetical protein
VDESRSFLKSSSTDYADYIDDEGWIPNSER